MHEAFTTDYVTGVRTVFVTGGSGYLGRNLISRLRADEISVRALVRSSSAAATVAALGAEPIEGSLLDQDALRRGMSRSDVVFHLAAKVGFWGNASEFQRVNVDGTRAVLAAARAAGVPQLVYASTDSVLVDGHPLREVDESHPMPARVLGVYGRTKALAEREVVSADIASFRTVALRPTLIWGRDDTTLLPNFVRAVETNQFAWIDGGRHRVSTSHVSNVCEAFVRAARAHCRGVYFVTDGEPTPVRTFVTALLESQDVIPPKRSLPHWLAWFMAGAVETAWQHLPLGGTPLFTRAAISLLGCEHTCRDAAARRDFGHAPVLSREQGLAELRQAFQRGKVPTDESG